MVLAECMDIQNFSLIPGASEDTASSRIRVYSLQRSLVRLGKMATLGYWPEADVLFIQKRVNRHILSLAEGFRKKGGLVLYDFDDLGKAFAEWVPKPYFQRMIQIAQVVTTDTAGHREALAAEHGIKHIELIPDCVDYFPTGPVEAQAAPG